MSRLASISTPGSPASAVVGTSGSAAAREHYRYSTDDSLRQEIGAFEAACAGREPYPLPPGDALRNVAFLEAVRKSGETDGSWVAI